MFKISLSKSQSSDARFQSYFLESFQGINGIARSMTRSCWSPIIWKGGRRRNVGFESASLLALDFDAPGYSIENCRDDFKDFIHIIGTTRSHQKEKGGIICDRFRLLVPFSRPIAPVREYLFNLEMAVKTYPADSACVDGARFFFPCKKIVSMSAVGKTYDVLAVPENYKVGDGGFDTDVNRYFYRQQSLGRTPPPWVCSVLRSGVEPGFRNVTCFSLGRALTLLGYDEDSVLDLVVYSPVCKGPDFELDEALQAIRNGIRYASKSLVTHSRAG